MSKKMSIFHVAWMILRMILKAAPVYIGIVLFAGVLHGIFKGLETLCLQRFFDQVTLLGMGYKAGAGLLLCFVLLAGVIILGQIFNGLHNSMIELSSFKVMGAMSGKLHEKVSHLSAEFYEDAGNLDCLQKAENGIEQGTFFLNVCFSIVAYYIPYFVFMGVYLALIKPVLIWAVVLVFFPVLLSQLYRNRMYDRLEEESAVYARKYQYYESCIKDRRYFKETRTLGAYPYFRRLYVDTIHKHNAVKWRTAKRTGITEMVAKGITLMGYICIIILFAGEVLRGGISIGTFAALFTSLNTMFHTMEELICGHISSASENLSSIINYVYFLELSQQDGAMASGEMQEGVEIEAVNLSYCYPGSQKMVLKQLCFKIRPGEMVAIVGENGAGKTTLMKLLSGQYTPASGKLLINGVESREIKRDSLAENSSAVFQDYQRYALKLGENVSISNMKKEPFSEKEAALLEEAGLDWQELPKGLDTMLSREFGGTDLSGGEWQKVAIARGAYRDSGFMILDEPTAAIDPMEEKRLYNILKRVGKGKTSLLVTHRIGAARLADRILVLEDGQIVEEGSHEQLLQKKGRYSAMYQLQKDMYYCKNNYACSLACEE